MLLIPRAVKIGGPWQVRFNVSGIKCGSCINQIKKIIYQRFSQVRAEADRSNHSFTLTFANEPAEMSSLVNDLRSNGFEMRPFYNKNFRLELIQIAIAGYALGNVMLMALADYFQKVEEPFAQYFRFWSLALATLSLVFAAKPLWQKSWYGLRRYKLELDFGILLGLVTAYLYSGANVFLGSGEVYFDSIAAVVFLTLLGRFFRNRALEKANVGTEIIEESDPEYCYRLSSDNEILATMVREIRAGDFINIRPGDSVPTQCKIVEGSGYIDFSSLTGEPKRSFVQTGDFLQAGTFAVDGGFTVRSEVDGTEGFIPQAQSKMDVLLHNKEHWQNQINRVTKGFVTVLFSVVALIFVLQIGGSFNESVRRSVALLLIACPCALGFGIPLAYSRIISQLTRKGIQVQNPQGLDFLPQCRDIVFDKTGTLTDAEFDYFAVTVQVDNKDVIEVAKSLSYHSHHHVPKALGQWANQAQDAVRGAVLKNVREITGSGMSAQYKEQDVKLGKESFACGKCENQGDHHLNIDGRCVLTFFLQEKIVNDALEVVRSIAEDNRLVYILSGDRKNKAILVADALSIPASQVLSEKSPDEKLDHIREGNYMMVGNGLNDMLAFTGSRVSVAVRSASSLAKNRADFYLKNPGVSGVNTLIQAGNALQKNLRKLFTFSFSYNLCALVAAVNGLVDPVMAAILMPLSSLVTLKIATLKPKGIS